MTSECDWESAHFIAPDGDGAAVVSRYVREALGLFEWNSARQPISRQPHWSLVLLRTGHAFSPSEVPSHVLCKFADAVYGMVDWEANWLTIDSELKGAK